MRVLSACVVIFTCSIPGVQAGESHSYPVFGSTLASVDAHCEHWVVAHEFALRMNPDRGSAAAAAIDAKVGAWIAGYVSGFEAARSSLATSKLAPKYVYDPSRSGDEKLVETVYERCKANLKSPIFMVTAQFIEEEERESK